MIYLSEFYFPSQNSEANYLAESPRAKMTCYDSFYPFGLFAGRGLKALDLADVTILYGGNGSGKSTLLHIMGTLDRPNSGSVLIDGMDVTSLWWALSLGACLGGNGTLIGASANVVLSGISAKHGHPITFGHYLKVGFPTMVLSVAISTVYLLVRFH